MKHTNEMGHQIDHKVRISEQKPPIPLKRMVDELELKKETKKWPNNRKSAETLMINEFCVIKSR